MQTIPQISVIYCQNIQFSIICSHYFSQCSIDFELNILQYKDRGRILVQVTINRRLLIGRDDHLEKPTIYRNLYKNTGPDNYVELKIRLLVLIYSSLACLEDMFKKLEIFLYKPKCFFNSKSS